MTRRLPPIQSLRAFEAAARTLSFTKAAEENFVTASAVSQQVRHLEDQLGVKLFRRLVTGLTLTDEGRVFLVHVREAFDALSAGMDAVGKSDIPRRLKLLVLSSFAHKWLVPRLGDFAAQHPNVEISLFHNHVPPDFASSDFDMAILWGNGEWNGCDSYFLMDELIFPICSPTLLNGSVERGDISSLTDNVILRTAIMNEWPLWLKAASVEESQTQRSRVFDDGSMMIDATIEGQGIGLARSVLAADALAAGRLVVPFRPIIESPNAYYTVLPNDQPIRPIVELFMEWLAGQARTCEHNRLRSQLQASSLTSQHPL